MACAVEVRTLIQGDFQFSIADLLALIASNISSLALRVGVTNGVDRC